MNTKDNDMPQTKETILNEHMLFALRLLKEKTLDTCAATEGSDPASVVVHLDTVASYALQIKKAIKEKMALCEAGEYNKG